MEASALSSREHARSPSWGRAVLLLPLVWWTFALGSGARTWCFLDYVNLAFHEAGHLFFGFLGSTVMFLGGSLGQLLVPLALALNFRLREERPFGAAVCSWWVGQNLINISVYMADARALSLPLVGGGDHDWNELFFRWGTLGEPAVRRISGATHGIGLLLMLLALTWSLYYVLPAHHRRSLVIRWPWLTRLVGDD